MLSRYKILVILFVSLFSFAGFNIDWYETSGGASGGLILENDDFNRESIGDNWLTLAYLDDLTINTNRVTAGYPGMALTNN